ncbi:Rrp5-like protein [Plakobranchus ocellatus]|uniref:Rrp5-like protein n=1 Tax=Plakobranchus ocellatus TaxID=259542 RepID=A0AAV3YMG8_9GAST|nr:Rrp5-like protein [Plakobranchus ocellatus]
MWKAEADFPRGGGRQKASAKEKALELDHELDDQENLSKSKKGDKTVKKRKLPFQNEETEQSIAKKPRQERKEVFVRAPLQEDLYPEVCVLSCVSHASDYSVSVSLPGHLTATLPITDIAPAYTQQLQALAQADDPSILDDVSPVESLFKPGMLLPVKIKEIREMKQNKKRIIRVSSSPADVNQGVPRKAVNNGQLFFGSVSSIEDHGYRIDLGIKGLQAFLGTKDAEKLVSKQGMALCIGQPLWCVLKLTNRDNLQTGESRVVNVTVDPESVQKALLPETSNLDSVRPGMAVTAIVTSISANGLCVNVFNFEGSIHSSQLFKTSAQYKCGEEIRAKVLYINPTTKELHLTNLPKHLEFDGTPLNFFGDLKAGDFLDGKTSRFLKGKGVYFSLPGKVKGFAAMSHLSDNMKEAQDLARFQKGQTFRCRVLGFNFMEALALVSLKQSVLDQKFLSVKDISVGEILEVFVQDVTSNGLVVKISKGIYSFIPCMHLADVPIKHPEKKFEADQKLKCRVLKVDLDKSKVMLTLKKSLVKLKGPILTDYNQLRPYMELEGYIIAVKETVVVVAFFNGVQGFVTLKDMSMEKVEDPSLLFYKGQVIRCRVVHYNAEEKKLKLSFNLGEKKEVQEKPTETVFELGKCLKAKIVREEKDGFRIQLLPNRDAAFLPFHHLSDFHEVQEIRKQALKPGQIVDKVTFFSVKNKTIVTMKESFLQAAQEKNFATQFDDIAVGSLLPAVIKNHQDYGMFLEIAGGLTGLCPAKTMTALQPANLQSLFLCGQSVTTRITRLDSEKKRFLGSVRLDECFEGGLEPSLTLLQHFLLAHEEAVNLLYTERDDLAVYEELSPGTKVKVTVTSVLKKGILGELPSGANALATKDHFGGLEPKLGSTYEAVVMYVDPISPCLELTLEPKIVKAVSSFKDNVKTQLKKGQVLKADVLLVKPEFMLMCARGHGSGRLLYVPVRQHINDVEWNKAYKPGTFTDVVIKEKCGNYQLAVLKSQDPDVPSKTLDMRNMKKHNLKPGDIINARIRAVHPLQLNIEVDKVHGRVHITEVDDEPQHGVNPLQRYQQSQFVKAVIIGLRDIKSDSYLPISHPKSSRSLLECSLRQSKLENPSETENLVPKLDLKVGEEVTGYVISATRLKVWLQLSLTQQGYVDHFHFSTDLDHIGSLKFRPGQACTATVTHVASQEKFELSFIGKKLLVQEGAEVPAQITSLKPECSIHVKLPDGRSGVVKSKPSVLHYVGQHIKVVVDKQQDLDVCLLSLADKSKTLLKKQRKRKTSTNEEEAKIQAMEIVARKKQLKKEKKQKKISETEEQNDSGVDLARESAESDKEQEKVDTNAKEAPCLSIAGFSWGEDMSVELDKEKKEKDDDEDNDDAAVDVKTKKKRKRDEEKLIQQYERSQLDGTATPQSANDFEKLALQSPNSSLVWLRYMAFHVELGETEKARAVAEKALSTISFREEQEKKNVWLAYLNMETTYGDSADVKKLLERAVTYNDPLDIYLKMCDIYVSANKMEDAEQLYTVMSRKFKREKSVWKAYGQFLFKATRLQSARNLLQRCTSILDKKDHVEVITKFATLEFSDGEAERGRTMFENLIASYPSRTDIWSVYVDMVVKSGDIAGGRDILDRAVKQKFGAKKLSFLIQKMIKFEETHGTDEQIQRAKDMAITLLQS